MNDRQKVLVVGHNLFFLPRIQNVAVSYAHEVRQTPTVEKFWEEHREDTTALILIDLEGDRDIWTSIVKELRRQGESGTKVVAFGPHADVATLELARNLGCDAVLTKGQFSSSLQKIIESRGADVPA